MKTFLPNKTFVLAVFLFAVLMSACGQTNRTTQVSANTEIFLPVPPSQTLTPKMPPTKILISTGTPNSYDATFSASFVTSKARTEATRTAAYATLESRNAVCDSGYHYIYPAAEYQLMELDRFSTNQGESWTVIKCLPEKSNPAKGYTKVANSDNSITWKISYDTFALPDRHEFLSGYQIDQNGEYLYLVPGNVFDRDGWCPSCLFGYGSPLYRLELSSGKLMTILPYLDQGYYVDITISPDGRYLVYSDSRDGNNVYMKDLIGGSDTKFELENIYVINGGFTWTPDGKTLVFAAGVNGWDDGKAGISLFKLNLSTMKLQILLLNDKRNLVPWFNSDSSKTWLEANVLNLASIKVNERDFSSNEWSINIKTGEVIRLSTPTPTPTP